MLVKTIKDEDFVNFKECSMFIGTTKCSFKCCKEAGMDCSVCQNYSWSKNPVIEVDNEKIIERYLNNLLTTSVVIGGLEPFDTFIDLYKFIKDFRKRSNDKIVIYTGYNESEIEDKVDMISEMSNIIIKFGRYKPNQEPHFDKVLGVNLASDNQYAKIIS